MNYKLIAMDLDGTLNNDQKTIDPPTRDALLAAQAAGVRLLLASARPLPGLYKDRDALELSAHGGLLMAYNGGAIVSAAPQGRLHHPSMAGPPLNSNLIVPSGLIHSRSTVFSQSVSSNPVIRPSSWITPI